MAIYDISEPIEPGTAVFPGDTAYSREWVMRMPDGAVCNLSTMHLSAHCGTHADAPLHFDDSGRDVASIDLAIFCGRCRVLAVDGVGDPALVDPEVLTDAALAGVERVLFRTREAHDHTVFDPDYTAVGAVVARRLVAASMGLVGIDTPSVDPLDCEQQAGHRILIAGGVAILENLNLSEIEPGDYELIALPLRIVGGDASPVRAILRGP